MAVIEYMGNEVDYNERCLTNWRWQKDVASSDPSRAIRAMERLLRGRDDYYSYVLTSGKDMSFEDWDALDEDAQYDLLDSVEASGDAIGGLIEAIMENASQSAKN